MHGFHIHTYGDVSVDTGTAAGGHFADPRGSARSHGYPDSRMRHWGDFGNLVANDKGVATFDVTDRVIRLRGIVGRGMIIHAGPDMGPEAQPSGGAGAREAQCVIGIANPASVPA